MRAVARLARALGALAALAALLVGAPTVLLRIAPLHLPSSWPHWADVVDAMTRPDDGHLLVLALSVIAWAGWAVFTLSAVVEAAGRIRGVPAIRLPGLGAPQRLAAALMASTAVILSSAAAASIPAPMPRPPVATAPAAITPSLVADTVPRADRVRTDERVPRVTVQRGDTLWELARRHLDNGNRYPEIAALNYGRPQPDGRTLTSAHWLRPGWTLLLPLDATGHGPSNAGAAAMYTVRPHDSLWTIAADQLGDGKRYAEIVTLNRGRPQADGGALTDPDSIHPGWTLRLPAPAPDRRTPPTETPPDPVTTPAPAQTPALPSPSESAASSQTPSPSTPTPPSVEGPQLTPSSTAAPRTAIQSPAAPSATPEASPIQRADDEGIHLPGGFLPWPLAGAITAAAAMVWLRRRHRTRSDPDVAAEVGVRSVS
jgi:nucleoid-associated protein YgaU